MSEASRDQNHVPTMLGVSSTDGVTPIPVEIDPVTGRLLVDSTGGSGYTNLTQFVNQTPWRIFYSDVNGDVLEFAFGAAGEVLTSGGASAAPTWSSAGAGDMTLAGVQTVTGAKTFGTIGGAVGKFILAGSTSGSTIVNAAAVAGSTTVTLPGATTTLVGTDTTDTLTNKTLTSPKINENVAVTTTATKLNYLTGATGTTGTSTTNIVFSTSPTLVTPVLGVATATSINKVAFTAPATGSTLTILDGKTLTVNHSLTFAGTDSTTMTFPTTSKTVAANDGSNWTFTSQAIGDLVYASSTTAFTRLAAVAVGSVLVSAGTGTAPAYSANPQITTIELGNASDTTLSRSSAGVMAVEGVVIPSISSTNTLTNKRITKRTGTTTSSATPTINTDNVDFYSITAQTTDITSFTTNLSGTPTENQTLWIAITGTAARAITWGSSFEASTVALPTTTVTTNRLDVLFVWNTVSSKWRCVASA